MNTTLFVANIDYQVTAEELRALFEKHGLIRRVSLIIYKETGRSKGYAFIECETKSEAEKCKDKLRGHKFGDREITIKWAKQIL